MLQMNSLKRNLIINVGYQLLAVAIPLILAPYVSRTIGPEGVGIYSYTYNFAYCFALVGMLGVANYGNRTIASVGDDMQLRSRHFWNIWCIQVIVSVAACLAYVGCCLFLELSNSTIVLVHIVTVACSIFDISWFFFGIEMFQATVARNLVVKVLNTALILVLVNNEGDLLIYSLIMVGGALLNNLLLFPFLKKEIIYVRPTFQEMKQHIKPMIVLFFPVVAISIYKIMDKVMVGALSTTTQTGFYEYAEKIIGLPGVVITAVGSVMLPRVSAILGKNGEKKAKFFVQITMEVMIALTCAMAWGIFGIATDFAPAFFGEEFAYSGIVMMGLAPSVVCQSWANVIRTQYLIPAKMDTVYVQSTWIGAVVNFVVNALLIPYLHAMGAALGTLCAELAVAAYQSIKVRKVLPVGKYLRYCGYYLIPSAVMVMIIKLVSCFVDQGGFVLIALEIVAGGFAYCVVALPYMLIRLHKFKQMGAVFE